MSISHRLFLFLFFSFLLLSPSGALLASPCENHIVQFHGFAPLAVHISRLVEAANLGRGGSEVEIVPRRGVAGPSFPTDFVLVRLCGETDTQSAHSMILSHPAVKSITLDRLQARNLLVQEALGEERQEKQRFGSRALLGSGKRVSAAELYGAAAAWKRGIDGSGVKIAVFDSGLDCSHPDFRILIECHDYTEGSFSIFFPPFFFLSIFLLSIFFFSFFLSLKHILFFSFLSFLSSRTPLQIPRLRMRWVTEPLLPG